MTIFEIVVPALVTKYTAEYRNLRCVLRCTFLFHSKYFVTKTLPHAPTVTTNTLPEIASHKHFTRGGRLKAQRGEEGAQGKGG